MKKFFNFIFLMIMSLSLLCSCSGETWPKGPQGEQGIQGQPGKDGVDGLSAYELYCKYHPEYSGTEEDWINDILMGGNTLSNEDICDGLSVKYVTGLGFYIDGYYGTAKDIKIPSTILGKPVCGITEEAFKGSDSITSIEIPVSITSIGGYAFSGCSSLTTVTFEEGSQLTSIASHAFYNCSSLAFIEIPEAVTSIGDLAFMNCSSLTSIKIPEGVTSIGGQTFSGCSSLTSIEIPEGVTSVGNSAFSECSSLESITIPESIINIGSFAFDNCSSLKYNEYGNCKYLGTEDNPYFALVEATSTLFSSYTIHEDTRIIGASAFEQCFGLTNIIIPKGVTSIGGHAFVFCNNNLTIYCEVLSKPSGWNPYWNEMDFSSYYIPVYWAGEWEYDANGNPVPLK